MSTAAEKQLAIERAIAHRRCVEALTSIQAPLEVLRPVFKTAGQTKVLAQMDKIERWLDACIKPLASKKFGAKARDEFSQKNNFLAQTADMESMSHEDRFSKWCALSWPECFCCGTAVYPVSSTPTTSNGRTST